MARKVCNVYIWYYYGFVTGHLCGFTVKLGFLTYDWIFGLGTNSSAVYYYCIFLTTIFVQPWNVTIKTV